MTKDSADIRLAHLDTVLVKHFRLDVGCLEQRLAVTELSERQVEDGTELFSALHFALPSLLPKCRVLPVFSDEPIDESNVDAILDCHVAVGQLLHFHSINHFHDFITGQLMALDCLDALPFTKLKTIKSTGELIDADAVGA